MPNTERDLQQREVQPTPPDQDWGFDRHGLIIVVSKPTLYVQHAFQDIPEETIIGLMHFTPAGNTFIPKTRSFVLAEAVVGLDAFFEELDKHDLKPTYLIGHADERMAKFATSVGFKLTPDHRYKDLFSVVGETETVRREFLARKKRSRIDRLAARANRQPTLQPTR